MDTETSGAAGPGKPVSDASSQPDVERLQSELEELRARNTELEAARQLSTARRLGRVGRSAASATLLVLGVLCLVVSPIAIWGRNLVLDTNHYVETLKPVAADPGIQGAVITAVDNQVTSHIDMTSYLAAVLPPRPAHALGGPLQSAVSSLVNNVTTKLVHSAAFQTLWVDANRAAHQQVVYLLTGTRPGKVAAIQVSSNGTVNLNLGAIVDRLKTELVADGLSVASKIPSVGATIEIGQLKGLDKARAATRFLNTTADWLPWIGVALAAGGIAAARKRRRAVIKGALGLAAGMLVIGLGLLVVRNVYLGAVPADKLPRDAAASLFDTIVRFLRLGIRLVLLVALLVAFGTWISGSSRAAAAARRTATHAPQALGSKVDSGPVGPLVARHATAFRIGVIGFFAVVLFLIDSPSLATVILLAVLAVVLLLVVELLRASGLRARPVVG